MKKSAIPSILVAVILLTVAVIAGAQQTQKIPKIGVLAGASTSSSAANMNALRQGLRELGYFEGKNIVLEHRHADGKLSRLPEIAAELVRLNVDVIVASGTQSTKAAKQATSLAENG